MIHLRRLELRGFKTFAPPTALEFVAPLTAIVGPNGSGKSNVADAVRWVLGEQSLRLLRGRKTEDIIFAGSAQRAPAGLAEVQLTLDNATGWLPLPHAEVTIGRRAHRSGENEYLINRQPVRLRDYQDLLLRANVAQHAYSVIGQGMIDAALSQRPEERRAMFEEAADLKRFQAKIAQAQQNLAATEQNLERVSDVLVELTPRLAALERLAERAARHASVERELRELLVRWHRHRWRRAQLQLDQVSSTEATAQEAAALARAALAQSLAEVEAQDAERRRLEEETTTLRAERDARRTALARVDRDLAVAQERARALAQQHAALVRDAAGQAQQQGAVDRALADLRRQRDARAAERERERVEVAALEQRLAPGEPADAETQLRERVQQLSTAVAALEREGVLLEERRASFERELAAGEAEGRRLAEAADLLVAERDRRAEALRASEGALAAHTVETRHVASLHVAAQAAHDAARQRLEEARRLLTGARARAEVLERLDQELAGYQAGPRAVLAAARAGHLRGILGAVGPLLRVPPHLERAVGAALGAHGQDLVVERRDDAEQAISWLRQTGSGRATFLPLDALRVAAGQAPDGGPEGRSMLRPYLGVAADLVGCEPQLELVVRYLLGRTLVVEDLPAARRTVGSCPLGWQLATLDGELVHASGALAGGSPATGGDVLTRERERRELPEQVASLARQEAADEESERHAREALARAQAALKELEEEERRSVALCEIRRAELAALERERAQAATSATARGTAADEARARLTDLLARIAALEAALGSARAEHEAAQSEYATRRAAAEQARAAAQQSAVELAKRRTALALVARDLEYLDQAIAEREREQQRLAAEAADRGQQLAALEAELQEQEAACRALAAEHGAAQAGAAEVEAALSPGEETLRRSGDRVRDLEAATRTRREELAATEARLTQAALVRQHADDELAALRRQIAAEWEDQAADDGAGVPHQLVLPLAATAQEPGDDWLLADTEPVRRRIDALRQQLRSIGAVDANALDEHRAVAERHGFLTSQAADLQRAAADLRHGIAGLEHMMGEQFESTFAAVNREFRNYFRQLFGGGHARLELTAADDPGNTGVEIVAQPPGRRIQSVGALSGGERALTGTALLFALLRAHPTPFCVLDEVDAALDEANIQRFLDALQGLVERTQFVVITHNRATMAAAGTLYGVTMGSDAISRVLSLRLEDVRFDDGAGPVGM